MKIHNEKNLIPARGSINSKTGLTELCFHILSKYKIEKMVEVGCYMGESTNLFYNNLKCEIYCVDPWEDFINNNLKVMKMNEIEKIFDQNTMNNKNIKKIKSNSEIASKLFNDKSLDFVYIDANHDYEYVKKDIEIWRHKIKKDCFIGGHDYHKDWMGVIAAVNESVGIPDIVFSDTSWLKLL